MRLISLLVLESIVLCFILLIICVIGIANGPIGLVVFYEKDAQDRVVELGLTTKQRIKKTTTLVTIALFAPMLVLTPTMVYFVNEARGLWNYFIQMAVLLWVMGLFDRIFIDGYWVGHTKAWFIPGTEDLLPYIPKKTAIKKWVTTLLGYPLLALLMAWIMSLICK